LPQRKPDIGGELVEPLYQSHLTISLSTKVDTGPCELTKVADSCEHDLARRLRIHPALDQFSGPKLDVQRQLLVDLLIEWDAPQP
jgi:hypothetical protein